VIGADVGSQSVKAVLMDPDGTVLGCASRPCSMAHPHSGWAEQRPQDWRDGLAGAVREVCWRSGVATREVAALGLASQVDGVVAMDARREALRPAIIWLDRRGEEQAARFAQRVGAQRLAELTGLQPDASHGAPKAMWLADHQPDVMRKARWLAPVAGYMVGWLTGEVVQDHANASSSMLYDIHRRDWAPELVEAAGLEPEALPPIRPAHATAGTLTVEASDALGLPRDCKVAVGTGDDHAATVGAGAYEPGVVVDVTGTAEPVTTPASKAVIDGEGLVETHAHAIDRMLLVENPGFVSGGSTAWLAGLLELGSQADVFAAAEQAPPGSDGVVFLPALSGAMAPRWNSAMRGCFAGLALGQDARQLSRAVLEGCAYALRDIVDRFDALGVGAQELRVVGGGARSHLWMQVKADVTGRPVRRVTGEEATAAGAAMLAAVAAGTFASVPEAMDRIVALDPEVFEPDPAHAELYAAGYARYRNLYDAVEGTLP
jgi:xylulokinase